MRVQRACELGEEGLGLIHALEDGRSVCSIGAKMVGDAILNGTAHELNAFKAVWYNGGDERGRGGGGWLPSNTFGHVELEANLAKALLPDGPHE